MTSPVPIIADPVSPVVPLDLVSWTGWLQEQVDPLWRPGEWAQEAWFFDGDLDHPPHAGRQPWLREVLKTWAETVSMKNDKFKRTFNACVVASDDALHTRPGGGKDVTRLRFADVQDVFGAMSCIRRSDNGELARHKWRMHSFCVFLDLIYFGRKTDMLDGLPGSFNRDKTLVLPPEETIEGAAGKAVPESVIDHMDAHLP